MGEGDTWIDPPVAAGAIGDGTRRAAWPASVIRQRRSPDGRSGKRSIQPLAASCSRILAPQPSWLSCSHSSKAILSSTRRWRASGGVMASPVASEGSGNDVLRCVRWPKWSDLAAAITAFASFSFDQLGAFRALADIACGDCVPLECSPVLRHHQHMYECDRPQEKSRTNAAPPLQCCSGCSFLCCSSASMLPAISQNCSRVRPLLPRQVP